MKKTTLLFSACLFSVLLFAQIPNPGFENWVNNNESPVTYLVPQNWVSHDVINSVFADAFGDSTYVVNSVSRVTGHTGQYAVQTAVVQSNEQDTVGGALYSFGSAANFFQYAFYGLAEGFTYNMRPANLTGFYKLNSIGGDTAGIGVFMSKWNTTTNSRDILMQLTLPFTTNATGWTAFTIPLSYDYSELPDTVLIIAGLSGNTGVGGFSMHPGSTFAFDDFAFTGNVPMGIHENNIANESAVVMPNPFNEQTTLRLKEIHITNGRMELYDVLGNKVREMENLSGNNFIISREGLPAGIYFYTLSQENTVLATGKISVE
ncbi:MAG: T9SS type A sorting domain-containing protein [Bacteroidia bacterium]